RKLGDRRFREDPGHLVMSRSLRPVPSTEPLVAATAVRICSFAYLLLTLVGFHAISPANAQSPAFEARTGREPITPIPVPRAQDRRRVLLGERLFSDRRLSQDNTDSSLTYNEIGITATNVKVQVPPGQTA